MSLRVGAITQSNNSTKKETNKIPTNVIATAVVGTLLTTGAYVYSLARNKNGKNILQKIRQVELGIKEGILLCTSSTVGGLIGGLLADKKENRIPKLQESVHQIVGNGVIPFSCLAVANLLTKRLKQSIRTVIAIGTLFASTFLGHNVVDKIIKTPKKYEVGFIDFAPDIDDWVLAASTVIKNKALYKFTATICPLTYTVLGIKTGLKQKEENNILDIKS